MLLPAALLAGFLALRLPFAGFFIDDAFITFRFAEHLAEGHGIVWNVGEDPVEGPTSMLWVLLMAIPALLGIPVPGFAKALGLAAGAASIVIVYAYARRRGCQRPVATAAGAIMALSPSFVLIALQGMETSVAGLLALLATIAALAATREPTPPRLIATSLSLLLAVLARPDLAVYGAGLLAATVWRLARRDVDEAKRALGYTLAFLVVPGLVYMALRWSYFGYPFPNAFYIKQTDSFTNVYYGGINVFGFLTVVIGPLLALAAWRLAGDENADATLARLSPPLTGAALFLPLWLFMAPVQGYAYRFQMPIVAPLALTMALAVRRLPHWEQLRGASVDWRRAQPWLAVALAVMLVLFPLHSIRSVGDTQRLHSSQDRIAAGQALAPLEDTDARMFVTEAGAVPYYSGWEAVDLLGLTNETIAHEGVDVSFIEDFDPDLVMVRTPVQAGIAEQNWPTIHEFAQANDYRVAAIVDKHLHPRDVHLYMVDPDSEHADDITCQLLTIENVDHRDRAAVSDLMELGLDTADATRERCQAQTA